MAKKNPDSPGEIAHRLRNHVQIIASLLNLHADQLKSANVPDLLKKLQMRLEVMVETSLLASAANEDQTPIRDMFGVIEKIAARIYENSRCYNVALEIGDLQIGADSLATLGQIYSELLSNIYLRPIPGGGQTPIVVKIHRVADERAILSLRVEHGEAGKTAGPVDPLTAKMIAGLTASIGGEILFDREAIYDARLIFPVRAALDAP